MDPGQIAAFKRDGFVIVPREQWLSLPQLESWRQQTWAALTVRPDEPQAWPDDDEAEERNFGVYTAEARRHIVYPWSRGVARAADGRGSPADPFPVHPSVGQLASVRTITDQLMGAGMHGDGMDPDYNGLGLVELDASIWRWPVKHSQSLPPWQPPKNGHVEHYRGGRPDKPTPHGWNPVSLRAWRTR